MLFNSLHFLWFFSAFCTLFFYLSSQRSRQALLFFASCYFYGFFIPSYLLILFLVILIDFNAAKKIETTEDPKRRKFFLVLSIAANLSILIFFKYAPFLIENYNEISRFFQWHFPLPLMRLILPIGLSFHTFQSISYVFEVYQKRQRAEPDLLSYSVFVLYFPQLVAGPIERPQNVLPQLHRFIAFDEARAVSGLYLIAQGLLKKGVLADHLAPLANSVFDHPDHYGFAGISLGIVAFSFQIYGDFSGYSDIARGSSRILGIELMQNFNKPYFATSIGDFWRRWHISLSTWFRDYLYIPLGGNRTSRLKNYFNLLLVFTLSGLWHGAHWTFVIWGVLHGFYLLVENAILKPLGQSRWPAFISRIYVLIWVGFTWVFFRASNLSNALEVLKGLRDPFAKGLQMLMPAQIYEAIFFIAGLLALEAFDQRKPFWPWIRTWPTLGRWSFYWILILFYFFTLQLKGAQFIYFQF